MSPDLQGTHVTVLLGGTPAEPCVAPKGSGPSHAQNSGRFSTQVMNLGVLST